MLHKEFWGLLFLAFVGWIFVSASPTERIEHFCRPVAWVGNVGTSATAMMVPTQQVTVQTWFDKFEYGCRYMTWRLIYQADYNKAMGVTPGQQATPETTVNGAAPVKPATTGTQADPAGAK